MAKVKASGAKGAIGFKDPNVDRIEVFRGHTTRNPLHLSNARISQAFSQGKNSELRKRIIDKYNQTARGRTLFANGLPPVLFNADSLQHDFSQKNLSQQKISILTDHDRLNHLMRNSTVLEKRVKITSRSGNIKGNKQKWEHFWEVKGRVFIGNKDHTFTISVFQEKGSKFAQIYDIKLRLRQKKRASKNQSP